MCKIMRNITGQTRYSWFVKLYNKFTEAVSLTAYLIKPFFIIILSISTLYAANKRWDGDANDGVWDNKLNWSDNLLPSTGDIVLVDAADYGANAFPVLNIESSFVPEKVKILNGGRLDIVAGSLELLGGNFVVTGLGSVVNMSGGKLGIAGDKRLIIESNGIFNHTGGLLIVSHNLNVRTDGVMNFSNGTETVMHNLGIQEDGTYNMTGSGCILNIHHNLVVREANSLFNLEDGEVIVHNSVVLNSFSTGNTTIAQISGGSLSVSGYVYFKNDNGDMPTLSVAGGEVTINGQVRRLTSLPDPPPVPFIDIDISGGTVTFKNNIILDNAGDRFDMSGGQVGCQNSATLINAGIFTATGGIIEFEGSSSFQNTGSITFYDLTITANSTNIISNDITVSNDFTIEGSTVDLGGNIIHLNGNSTFTGGNIINGIVDITGTTATFGGTLFNALVSATCDNVFFNGSVFNSTTTVEKNGAGDNISEGGCTFDSEISITNTGSGLLRLAGTDPDDYNADATFIKAGTGDLQPACSGNNTFTGNITVNSDAVSFGGGGGAVILDGSTAQVIGGTSTATFNDLTVNNTTPANAVTLDQLLTVNGALTLTDGHIHTTDVNLLTLGPNSTVNLNCMPQDSSFVVGPMKHIVSTDQNIFKIFPIGEPNKYRVLELTVDQSISDLTEYYAEIINGNAYDLEYTLPGSISNISKIRYYHISQTPSTALDLARIRFAYGPDDEVTDPDFISIVKSDGAGNWTDIDAMAVGTPSGKAQSGIFTSFSFFALANKIGGTNALPVNLLDLNAMPDNGIVNITWSTATEINSDYFTVERTTDLLTYEQVALIPGAGNSNTILGYSAKDMFPHRGISYYRLKQTDLDGRSEYSNPVAVQNNPEYQDITVYPNPSDGLINIALPVHLLKGDIRVEITDICGRVMYSENIKSEDIFYKYTIDLRSMIPKGTYIISLTANNNTMHHQIIITNSR